MGTVQSSLLTRTRERRREEIRAAILEAAQSVFSQTGYQAARMEEIAKATGVATGTLYNYFESKAEVFGALMGQIREQLMSRLAAIEQTTVGVARLRALVRECFTTVDAWGHLFSLHVEAIGTCGPLGDDAHARACAEFLELIEVTISASVQGGELRDDVPAPDLSRALAGTLHAFMIDRLTGDSRPLVERTDTVLQLFLEGAAPR